MQQVLLSLHEAGIHGNTGFPSLFTFLFLFCGNCSALNLVNVTFLQRSSLTMFFLARYAAFFLHICVFAMTLFTRIFLSLDTFYRFSKPFVFLLSCFLLFFFLARSFSKFIKIQLRFILLTTGLLPFLLMKGRSKIHQNITSLEIRER